MKQSKSELIKSIIISWRKAIKPKMKVRIRRWISFGLHSKQTQANAYARLHCSKLVAIDTIARSFNRSLSTLNTLQIHIFFYCIWVGYFSQVWLYAIVQIKYMYSKSSFGGAREKRAYTIAWWCRFFFALAVNRWIDIHKYTFAITKTDEDGRLHVDLILHSIFLHLEIFPNKIWMSRRKMSIDVIETSVPHFRTINHRAVVGKQFDGLLFAWINCEMIPRSQIIILRRKKK